MNFESILLVLRPILPFLPIAGKTHYRFLDFSTMYLFDTLMDSFGKQEM